MLKVVPGIFVNDEDHLNGLIKVARSFSNEIHVDIADGEFVPTRSVGIEVVQKIVPDGYEYNLHLMTFLTKEGLITWSGTSAKRIFIYSNALRGVEFEEAFRIIESTGKLSGLVIEPNQSVLELTEHIKLVDEVMIMGVNSGRSGQPFIGGVLPKLGQVRSIRRDARIGVDGGINLETIKRLRGFDFAVSSSAIFGGEPQISAQTKTPRLSPTSTSNPTQPTIEATTQAQEATISSTVKPSSDLTNPEVSESQLKILLDQNPITSLSWNNFISYGIRSMVNDGVPTNTIVLVLMLPIIAAIAAFSRQVIGFKSFGIYTPTVTAVAFVATGLKVGLALFIVIVLTTTLSRYVLRYLKILYLPRTALILFFVSMAMFITLFFGSMLDIVRIETISIFPILILITLTENFVNIQLDKNLRQAAVITAETLVLAVIGFLIMQWSYLQKIVLINPELTFVAIIAFIILIGRWTGLRLVEYLRFREVLKYGKE